MADLYSSVDGEQSLDELIDRLARERTVPEHFHGAIVDVADSLKFSRAIAKAHFGIAATPEHALDILGQVMIQADRLSKKNHTDNE